MLGRLDDYISGLSFNVLQPDAERAEGGRLAVPRRSGGSGKLLELPRAAVDVVNLELPPELDSLHEMVAPQNRIRRMSSFAVGTLINRAVAEMPSGNSYVNVGTWAGFSLWAGMVGNPDKRCVGIDDFSQYGGPRKYLLEWFDRLRAPNHEFHEMDYRDYFARVHQGPIGVYFYDGFHSYEQQLLGLQVAEPFFGDNCVVIVDDTNWSEPYEATYDFMASSERGYSVLLDQQTAEGAHPTFWNGLVIFRMSAPSRGAPPRGAHEHVRTVRKARDYEPVPNGPDAPLVSLVLRNSRSTPLRLEAAIEEVLAQQWPSLEVLVADEQPRMGAQELVDSYAGRVAYVPRGRTGPGGTTALAAAVDATRGEYVSLVDAETELDPSAVRIGFAFPGVTEFQNDPTNALLRQLERALDLIDETSAVVPAGSSFAIINGWLPLPEIDNGRVVTSFWNEGRKVAPPPDDDAALERLARLRDLGTEFIALGWLSFELLDRFRRFSDELEAQSLRVLDSEIVKVFDLRR
jgi:Glycosyl transferase family 2/Methyltransferase domain